MRLVRKENLMSEPGLGKFVPDDAENLPAPVEETIVPVVPEIILAPDWAPEREREEFAFDQTTRNPSIFRMVNFARKFELPRSRLKC